MNLSVYINKLPKEVIYLILSYSYKPQSKHMLEDIRHYSSSKIETFRLYREIWIEHFNEEEIADKNWLINDIISYANNNYHTIYGYNDYYLKIIFRNPFVRNNAEALRYIYILENGSLEKEINLYWGLFKIHEREDIITRAKTQLDIINVI